MKAGAKHLAGKSIYRFMVIALFLFPVTFTGAQEVIRHSHDEHETLPFATLKAATDYLHTDNRIDVLFYHISIEPNIGPDSITGNVRIRFRPVQNNVNAVRFNLRDNFTISSLKHFESEINIAYSHSNHIITLNFQNSLNLGDTTEIVINYSGTPLIPEGASHKGFRFDSRTVGGVNIPVISTLNTPFLAHYWYPCKDGPSDKADSVRVDITIPNVQYDGHNLIAVSNGLQIGEEDVAGDKKKYIWLHNYPIVPYYVMIAASNYQVINTSYTNNGYNLPLVYYVFPEEYASSQQGVSIMPGAMDAFIHYFGDYPFKNEKYGMTRIVGNTSAIEKQTNAVIDRKSVV